MIKDRKEGIAGIVSLVFAKEWTFLNLRMGRTPGCVSSRCRILDSELPRSSKVRRTAWKQVSKVGVVSVILHLALRHSSTFSSLCLHSVERLNFICTNVSWDEKLFSEWSFSNRDQPVCAACTGERFLQNPVVKADVAMSGKMRKGCTALPVLWSSTCVQVSQHPLPVLFVLA